MRVHALIVDDGASDEKTPRRLLFGSLHFLISRDKRQPSARKRSIVKLKRAIPKKVLMTNKSTRWQHSAVCVPRRREWSTSKNERAFNLFSLLPPPIIYEVMVVLVRIAALHQIYCRACVGPPQVLGN